MDALHDFLARESYWKRGVTRGVVQRAVENSLCFGLYDENEHDNATGRMVGGARCVTDAATFGYLADVYILAAYRGRGLGAWLMRCILAHPALQDVTRLAAHHPGRARVFEQVGFERAPFPERFMTLLKPDPWV